MRGGGGGGGAFLSLLRILGNIFFPGPVTFLKNGIFQKKNLGQSLTLYLSAKLDL